MLTNGSIDPHNFGSILTLFFYYLLPSPITTRRMNSGVSRFFGVLRHIRNECSKIQRRDMTRP